MTKVLVITYYWPPAGGPGVQRWLNFVRYLPEFDVEPQVFVPSNPFYPITDESLLAEIPANLVCYRQRTREPFLVSGLVLGKKTKTISSGIIEEQDNSMLQRLALWIRGNLFIPDARKSWVKPSIRKVIGIVEREEIDCIITTGPPHSTHLIGLGVKQRIGIRWIADFRDPWTNIGYHKKLKLTKISRSRHKELERQVLQTADRILTTSRTTAEEFRDITTQPIKAITNGYVHLNEESKENLDKDFSLSCIGSLLSGRNPENLWRNLSELLNDIPGLKHDLKLKLVGVVSESVLESLKKYNLDNYTVLVPYVGHEDAKKFQRRSQVLLLLENNSPEYRGIIPGKLFEYMAAKRPILAIGPKDWESGRIVQESKTGVYFNYEAESALKQQITLWYEQYKQGLLEVSPKNIERYSRKALTKELAEELAWE